MFSVPTFACTVSGRLEQLTQRGMTINPLMRVKVLMGHDL